MHDSGLCALTKDRHQTACHRKHSSRHARRCSYLQRCRRSSPMIGRYKSRPCMLCLQHFICHVMVWLMSSPSQLRRANGTRAFPFDCFPMGSVHAILDCHMSKPTCSP